MSTIRKIAFLVFVFFVITSTSNPLVAQQKYGHLNYGNLLEQIPEMKAADTELKTYRDQLVKVGEGMAQKLQLDLQEYQEKAQGGYLTGKQMQDTEARLQADQQKIVAYEQEVVQKVSAKRDQVLKPIVDKVNAAIQQVGAENGYAMIFDTSLFNTVLYAQDSEDVMDLVKKKLGL